MRDYREIVRWAEAHGLECEVRERGASFRAGGDIIVTPNGFEWRENPFAWQKKENAAIDPTGYDDRGRVFGVWNIRPVRPGEEGWRVVSRGQWENVPADRRAVIGKSEEGRSGVIGYFIAQESAVDESDIEELFGFFGDDDDHSPEPPGLGSIGI